MPPLAMLIITPFRHATPLIDAADIAFHFDATLPHAITLPDKPPMPLRYCHYFAAIAMP